MPEDEIAAFVGEDAFVAVEPEIFADNVEYLQAFMDLADSREIGLGGVGSIKVSEIGSYWDHVQIDDFLTFLRRLRAADGAFLKWQREQRDRNRDGS